MKRIATITAAVAAAALAVPAVASAGSIVQVQPRVTTEVVGTQIAHVKQVTAAVTMQRVSVHRASVQRVAVQRASIERVSSHRALAAHVSILLRAQVR